MSIEDQDKISPLVFPDADNMITDADGDPAGTDFEAGKQVGTSATCKGIINPIIKKVCQLIRRVNNLSENIKDYLPLSGGTLNGILEVPDAPEDIDLNAVLNVRSSDQRYMSKYGRPGDIVFREDDITPDGCIPLDGRAFDKSSNPVLARIYPSGNVKDYRGYVLRANDNGAGIDPGRVLGTSQSDGIRNIMGEITKATPDTATCSGVFKSTETKDYPMWEAGNDVSSYSWNGFKFDVSRVCPTAPEVRMKNLSVNFFVIVG